MSTVFEDLRQVALADDPMRAWFTVEPDTAREIVTMISDLRADLAVVREHEGDGERYRYIKANLRRLDIGGLCITDANAEQLDGRIDAMRGKG